MASEDIIRAALEVLTTPPGSPQLEALHPDTQAVVRDSQRWVTGPGVLGLGVADRVTSGQTVEGELALKVYVVSNCRRPVRGQHVCGLRAWPPRCWP
jgi:hypothetical protein